MPVDSRTTKIYHITDVANLQGIVTAGGLFSDAQVRASNRNITEIGYAHIKQRRLAEYTVPCCNNRAVGEFVPFYFCPRSPMLFTINKGSTGRPAGCQTSIVHLVSVVHHATALGRPWAISDGNAGAGYTSFSNDNDALDKVNWNIVRSNSWGGDRLHIKMTEFLIADFFPVTSFVEVGCHNEQVAEQVKQIMARQIPPLTVHVSPHWYY
ncbi:type II toxin-antitoxin system toxin DNA ADP-ribosyl transferase DarT [Noviherbaspirillum sp. Root189]|uniref:type II toxin-antitoxin system toxin DNA ADP-ribosyl transferase DarT n=1 Tax=Noviherbaspirillum sp. Root189 TaxID=1736487 RepID=UPI0009E79EB0|nr:DUF4433 domain-containing protein [Noviherbaspirillum sp. Root189]